MRRHKYEANDSNKHHCRTYDIHLVALYKATEASPPLALFSLFITRGVVAMMSIMAMVPMMAVVSVMTVVTVMVAVLAVVVLTMVVLTMVVVASFLLHIGLRGRRIYLCRNVYCVIITVNDVFVIDHILPRIKAIVLIFSLL